MVPKVNYELKQEIFDAVNTNDLSKVSSLIEKDSSIISLKDNLGNTPLHNAAIKGSVVLSDFLISKGADINARTNDGKSAYNIAEEGGYKELLNLIHKLGGTSELQRFPVLQGPYLGQQPPGNIMKRFAPGIVESDHSTVCTSPDGKFIFAQRGWWIEAKFIEELRPKQ
jgi:hypothetical protein